MNEIQGKAKTVRELMKGVKYSIDYYQREYKWRTKQVYELVDDLSNKFLEEYETGHARTKVADYSHYFLGSIIISKKNGMNYIVDGQQRLTSLTLLMILLRTLQDEYEDKVNVDELIFSTKFGQKSFNLDVEERTQAMEALYDGEVFDASESSESVQNLVQRYQDMESYFPDELRNGVLPYFVDWLLENVHLVEITAFSDNDAYTIFETMNDRGLSLSQTDMLKGYLLANIADEKRIPANDLWRHRITELNEAGKEVGPDSFKAWLRSQYATKIRERRKNAKPEDFDRIGTEFHRWVRDSADEIGLSESEDYYRFIDRDFNFYSRQYLRVVEAEQSLVPGLEHVYYNARNGFTLQNMLLLAPLRPEDDAETVNRKMSLVAHYLDIRLTWRLWNYHKISYSTMQYAMFLVMRDIRGLSVDTLAEQLYASLNGEKENFASNQRLRVHQQNRYYLHHILARMTDYIETRSGQPSHYLEYMDNGKNRYEVEHIWANHPEQHTDEFDQREDFAEYRNRIGGLVLLPKSFNASYGDLPYEEKLPHYFSHNLLARSLNPLCYERYPKFLRFMEVSGLPFRSYSQFKKADIEYRSFLYQQIAERVWNPDDLLNESAA